MGGLAVLLWALTARVFLHLANSASPCCWHNMAMHWSLSQGSIPSVPSNLQVEHNEFKRVLAASHAKEREEQAQQTQLLTINNMYKEELLAQIASNEELKKKERLVGGGCVLGQKRAFS